ncbi:translation factor guf1-related [Holotrichia oblita]|nr:translation factor guf1-related [Holotrichia oblita]
MKDQILDSLDLERERGITIKLNTVQLKYLAKNGLEYTLHLIDTPGHVDFTYEVSRSLASCEGAILVVDATQGVEAQTLANVYLALDNNLEIVPVINKIDLPSSDVDRVKKEIEEIIGLDTANAPAVSAKTGLNIDDVLEAIVKDIPPPSGDITKPLQALVFDSYYDNYKGVIIYLCVKNGSLKVRDKIQFVNSGASYEVLELGVFSSQSSYKDELVTGEVGFMVAGIKNIKDIQVGDTVTLFDNPTPQALPGYKRMKAMVYCGLFPVENEKFHELREALEKLQLNDSSLTFEPETSQALGFGFRVGFLGLLHMDVIEERLEREYNINLIATTPSVIYHVYFHDGTMITIDNPSKLPDVAKISRIEEPYGKVSIMTPSEYVGALMELCQSRRGQYIDLQYLDNSRMMLTYVLPLSEVIFSFFDKLKSYSKGYASMDYEITDYKESKLVRMDILLNGQPIDVLATIVHKEFAYSRGSILVEKLKEVIPRQQFEIPVQASLNNKVIARATIKALRKDVLAKCYGGDISRKRKLLEKQKEGKKRMKMVGNVEVPQEAFMSLLTIEEK